MNPTKYRIYIVDDHAVFRKGLISLINEEPDMEVCGEGDDCAVATQHILRLKPDLVIVDISLRGNNGIELIKNIKAVNPQIQVAVVSMHDESVYALRVLRVGAKAYVMKQDAGDAIIEAIRAVRKGQLHVSENVASQMLSRYAQGSELGSDSPVSGLSDRELEVLNLIGSGVSTREIAGRLHVSIKTVETHRAHLKSKLNLGTAAQLIQFAVRWVDRSEHVTAAEDAPAAAAMAEPGNDGATDEPPATEAEDAPGKEAVDHQRAVPLAAKPEPLLARTKSRRPKRRVLQATR